MTLMALKLHKRQSANLLKEIKRFPPGVCYTKKNHTEFDGVPAEACTISLYLNREYLGEVTAVI
jgi:hypothetical protein